MIRAYWIHDFTRQVAGCTPGAEGTGPPVPSLQTTSERQKKYYANGISCCTLMSFISLGGQQFGEKSETMRNILRAHGNQKDLQK